MKSSIPLLLLSICWIASFGNCDISYRVIRKNHNNGKQNQEEEQCMDEMRKACGASECCRKLFQLDESHAKSKYERASKMKDEHPNTEENFEEEEDEDEMESGSSPSSDDYPGKKGKHLISEDDPEFGVVKQKRKAQDCKKPKMQGPCLAVLRRFYYDSKTRKCRMFIYGGCYGNDNNFHTKKECDVTCVRPNES